MLCRERDPARGIDCEAAHRPGDAAGESKLARRVEKKQQTFAHAITLAGGPQRDPLVESQACALRCTPDGILDSKGDFDSLHSLAASSRTPDDAGDGSGEDRAGRADELRELE